MKHWKQRVIALLFAVLMAAMPVLETVHASGGQMAGDGTAENPYIIMDAEDLKEIDDSPSSCYVLGADIAPDTWTEPATTSTFSGTLDGNGYTITLPEGATASLLSMISGTVKNLNLYAKDVTVNRIGAGILMSGAGVSSGLTGTVENCSVVGNLTVTATGANINAGGFVPYMGNNGKITGSYAAVTITNEGSGGSKRYSAGALTGYTAAGNYSIADSYWDSTLMEASAGAYTSGGESYNKAEAKSTDEMKSEAFVTLLNEKNSGRTGTPWALSESYEGYPVLSTHAAILGEDTTASISGSCVAGQVLTASDTDDSETARTYEWYRVSATGESRIEGASSAAYTLTEADVGYRIKVVIGAEDVIGTRTALTNDRVQGSTAYEVRFDTTPADAEIVIKNNAGYIVSTEKNLSLANGTYYYTLGKDGYEAKSGTITVNGAALTETVSLERENITGYTWNETYNMAVTTDFEIAEGLPKGVTEDVYVKWATCIGLWQGLDKGEVTNPVFLNDSIYIIGEKQIKKVNPSTGEIEKTEDLTYSIGYNYFFQTAGDKLVIQEGTYLECFDADLNRLWVSENVELGSQGLCQLNYADGIIYGGTVYPGGTDACYFAISAADGKILWTQEPEQIYCGSNGNYTGYYWAGAAIIGDYLVYGSEGGRVYSTDRWTGEIVNRYNICDDASHSIRSSVAYDGTSIYFTDTAGYLYQIEYDETTGTFGTGKSTLVGEQASSGGFGGTCTATPVIYNNRLYVGSSTCLAVFDTTDLSLIYRVNHSYGTMRDLRLVADMEQDCVYVFTSYYTSPGSIVMMKDAPGQTSGELVDFSSLTTNWVQYNASMPIFGPDGTIYLTNDLGYLIAIGTSETWLTALEGNGTLDNELNGGITEYELVVAPGTEAAVFTLGVNDGSSLAVNGTPVTLTDDQGTVSVPMEEGTATVVIQVTQGDSTRTYTVNVREASRNTDMDYTVNQSNSLTGAKEVEELDGQVYVCYGQSSTFMRLWLKTGDENASHAVYALRGIGSSSRVDEETGLIGNTAAGTGTGAGYTRWNLYWDGDTMAVKAIVTAEDGVTASQSIFIITQNSQETFTANGGAELILGYQKENLLFELENYYSLKDVENKYEKEQQSELSRILETRSREIQAAADLAGAETILAAAKGELDGVLTSAQVLEAYISEAVEELNVYLNLENYRLEQQQEIARLLETYTELLRKAEDKTEVDTILAAAKEELRAVKTDEQLQKEENGDGDPGETGGEQNGQTGDGGTTGGQTGDGGTAGGQTGDSGTTESQTENSEAADSPKTGDGTGIRMVLILMLCAAIGLGFLTTGKRIKE